MTKPERILDSNGNVWVQSTPNNGLYLCAKSGYHSRSLTKLQEDFGPLRNLVPGDVVEVPSDIIPNGQWVRFLMGIEDVGTWHGLVHDYDAEKDYYRVIVTIPRKDVASDTLP